MEKTLTVISITLLLGQKVHSHRPLATWAANIPCFYPHGPVKGLCDF